MLILAETSSDWPTAAMKISFYLSMAFIAWTCTRSPRA